MENNESNIIIYNTIDGKASVWMNQNQLAELFDTSVPNVSMHIANVLKEGELERNSVIKNYLTTASDGKQYEVTNSRSCGMGELQNVLSTFLHIYDLRFMICD